MKLTPQEEQTIEAYNQNASVWAQSRNKKKYWMEEKQKFHRYVPSGKILEVGSGGGRDAKDLIALGYEYIGTDISQGLLEEAKKNNPQAKFLLQSVYDLDFPSETFDGAWVCATLLHMPKNRIDTALQSIYKVLKKGAVIFITLKKGEGERWVEGDHAGLNYKRYFSFYEDNEFRKILIKNNYSVIESYETRHSDKPWLVFFAKKS